MAAYRGLRKVRLEGLGRVNLFLGGTNTGKTSLLGDWCRMPRSITYRSRDRSVTYDFERPALDRHAQRTFAVWEGEPFYGQPRRHRFPKIALRTVTPYDHWLRSPATRGLSEAVLSGEEIDVIKLISSIEPRIIDVRLIEKQREPIVFLRDRQAGFLQSMLCWTQTRPLKKTPSRISSCQVRELQTYAD